MSCQFQVVFIVERFEHYSYARKLLANSIADSDVYDVLNYQERMALQQTGTLLLHC